MRQSYHRQAIDWTTVGIYWRSTLSGSCHSDSVASAIFQPVTAYIVEVVPENSRGKPLSSVMASRNSRCLTKWAWLKQFAAGLRYCYLSRHEVLNVQAVEGSSKHSILLEFAGQGGAIRVAESSSSDPLLDVRICLIQGGNPSTWFDLKRWSQIRPLHPSSDSQGDFPLSRPSYCDARYNRVLTSIGARRLRPGVWVPPAGTANDDMQEYVVASMPRRRGAA